jgi:YVTN family beta-propeller protein
VFGLVSAALCAAGIAVTVAGAGPASATGTRPFAAGDLVAYVSDSGSRTLTAVDLRTGVAHHAHLPFEASSLALTPSGRRVWVISVGGVDGRSTVTGVVAVDTRTLTVGRVIAAGYGPIGDVVTPDGRTLLVADMGDVTYHGGSSYSVVDARTVYVISTSSGKLLRKLDVGPGPGAITVTPQGKTAYVPLTGTPTDTLHQVVPIDLSDFRLGHPIDVGPAPMAVATSSDGKLLVVDNTGWLQPVGDTVTIVNAAQGKPMATVKVGPVPFAVVVTSRSRQAFVANNGYGRTPAGDSVSVIDLRTDRVSRTVTVGSAPSALAVTPAGTTVWVTHTAQGKYGGFITAINVATLHTGTSYPAGAAPDGIVIARQP